MRAFVSLIVAYQLDAQANPSCTDAYNFLGLMLQEQKDVDGAEAAYRAATEADPTDVDSHIYLGLLLQYEREDRGGAEAAYRAAIEMYPSYAEARIQHLAMWRAKSV